MTFRALAAACAATLLATPSFAVVEETLVSVPTSDTIHAIYFYDMQSGQRIEPNLLEDGAGVTIMETEMSSNDVEYRFIPQDGTIVQYSVHNNIDGFDIQMFGVTNPSLSAFAFTPEGVDCSLVDSGPCWESNTINNIGMPSEAFLELLLGDDQVINMYSFQDNDSLEVIEPAPVELIVSDFPESDEYFDMELEMEMDLELAIPSAILSGTTQDQFYFTNGPVASNIFGLATNDQGQVIAFSNVNLNPSQVPVPGAGLLLLGGLAGLGFARRKA